MLKGSNKAVVVMKSNVEVVANFVETDDTDGDGVKDADELVMGSDPWDPSSVLPPDGTPVVYVNGAPHLRGEILLADLAEIEFRTGFEGGSIFYTIDGQDPLAYGFPYSEKFTVGQNVELNAVAFSADYTETAG